ncbi:MAG: hypothetical protein ACLRSW_04355 [Christensenellaceae bacterium]
MPKELERYKQIERSIVTTYRKTIWSPFVLAVKISPHRRGDKIAVCISGARTACCWRSSCRSCIATARKFHLVFGDGPRI